MLEPGDLILVAARTPTWTSKRITAYQSHLFAEEHARWYHAAVSGGRFEICEAVRGGVRAVEYWDYMTGAYDLKVRRLRGASAATRSQLAYYAATNVRRGYGFLNLLHVTRYLRSGSGWDDRPPLSGGVICSQLYFEASMRVGYLLASIPPEAACPAQLSISALLDDVPLAWAAV